MGREKINTKSGKSRRERKEKMEGNRIGLHEDSYIHRAVT